MPISGAYKSGQKQISSAEHVISTCTLECGVDPRPEVRDARDIRLVSYNLEKQLPAEGLAAV